MMMQGMVALTKPAEFGFLMRAIAQCVQATTNALARQRNGNVAQP
jgi:hypothetical protein